MTGDELVEQLLVKGDALRNVRSLANVASSIALQLEREVVAARRAGNSWDSIAVALRGRSRFGVPTSLGSMFPGGTSTTTVRRMFESHLDRAPS